MEHCFERADRLPIAALSADSSWQITDEGKEGVRKLGLLSRNQHVGNVPSHCAIASQRQVWLTFYTQEETMACIRQVAAQPPIFYAVNTQAQAGRLRRHRPSTAATPRRASRHMRVARGRARVPSQQLRAEHGPLSHWLLGMQLLTPRWVGL